ncbi:MULTISPECIES: SHOCT domain-containing protein [unclassified Microcoleus]|uniref:SHOCT domain-containing protein n=1 Tax=unclassified Microcoleus TaxID=2642155 RepID=UPI002FCF7787
MTQPNILELAKQGDAKAIALLLNRQLQAKGITAAASLKDGCLQVMLEAPEAPSQQVLAPWVSKSIAGLGAASIEKVKVYGRQTGAKVPAWSQEFEVAGQKLPVADVTQQPASSSENTESNQLSLKERAKLGDVEAIASLLNLPLQNKGISATASLQDGCLQVMLESGGVPDEEVSIRIVRRELTNLKAGAIIASVKVYGQQAGEDFPAWNREFEIVVQTQPVKQNNNVRSNKQNNTITNDLATPISVCLLILSTILLFINWFWAIIIFSLACCAATQIPAQPLANAQSIDQLKSSDDLVKDPRSKVHLKAESYTAIKQKGLIGVNEQVVFYQTATYKGGVRGYPNASQNPGFAFVLDYSFAFYDNQVLCKLAYERIIEAKLDFFQMGGVRGFLASGDVGRQLQQTKNTLELCYLDDENTERSARFQIHGAMTIAGEAEKAMEFLNYLLEFKGEFTSKSANDQSDPISKLEKLKNLRAQGLITESEFDDKKRKLLDLL